MNLCKKVAIIHINYTGLEVKFCCQFHLCNPTDFNGVSPVGMKAEFGLLGLDLVFHSHSVACHLPLRKVALSVFCFC